MLKIISTIILSSVLLSTSITLMAAGQRWLPLNNDRLHDPESPAVSILQQPTDALIQLPPDTAGNQVSWIMALREGYINPRSTLFANTEVRILDMDIIMDNTGEMPLVRFPHLPHTEWLDCNNCHDIIFKEKVDANPINMFAILNGEYCGRCHGAVAFPLTECNRCHSVARNLFTGKPGVQPVEDLSPMSAK